MNRYVVNLPARVTVFVVASVVSLGSTNSEALAQNLSSPESVEIILLEEATVPASKQEPAILVDEERGGIGGGNSGGLIYDPREAYWTDQGFRMVWSSTPREADVGGPVESYLESQSFTNGVPNIRLITRSDVKPTVVSFDGFPAIRVESTPSDEDEQVAVKGFQLKDMDFNEVVFSMEIYNPSSAPLAGTRAGGRYQGRGVYWGAPRGQTTSPGGSNNRPDSWSVRSPYGANVVGGTLEGKDWLYVYPAREFTNKNSGDVRGPVLGAPDKKFDVWQRSEIRVLQNLPASSNNGLIENFVDGTKVSEWTGRLRWRDDVYPRGFGFFFQLKNIKTQILYIRDFKMYAR